MGVDIFFVISGYLITGHLIRSVEKTGSVQWRDFYKKRAKRILPVSLLTLAVSVITSYFLFGATRFWSSATDALYGFLFVSNWRFSSTGMDYFGADNAGSPFRHFWSLSI